jgi:tRNA A-37 threonylcarbamoyl transferase component Bud32
MSISISKMTEQQFEASYCYIKENVSIEEYKIHSYIEKLNIINVPKIYRYDKDNKKLFMQKINHMNISDFYGENIEDVDIDVVDEIRHAISTLYYANIEYADITGYNFIRSNGKLWVIDFGHAKYNIDKSSYDPFIIKFINGENSWNRRFA